MQVSNLLSLMSKVFTPREVKILTEYEEYKMWDAGNRAAATRNRAARTGLTMKKAYAELERLA